MRENKDLERLKIHLKCNGSKTVEACGKKQIADKE